MKIPRHSQRLKSQEDIRVSADAKHERIEKLLWWVLAASAPLSTLLMIPFEMNGLVVSTGWLLLMAVTGSLASGGDFHLPIRAPRLGRRQNAFIPTAITAYLTAGLFLMMSLNYVLLPTLVGSPQALNSNAKDFEFQLQHAGYTIKQVSGFNCGNSISYAPPSFIKNLDPKITTVYMTNTTTSYSFYQYGTPLCVSTTLYGNTKLNSTG